MVIKELKEISNAPSRGYVMTYTRDGVVFDEYTSIEDIKNMFEQDEILEIHLFDSDKEYRAIQSSSKRFGNNAIECIVEDTDYLDKYVLNSYLDHNYNHILKEISVVNYLEYDEVGSVSVCNYRLCVNGGDK